MPVTLHEMAKIAGLSVSTVSRSLTNSDHHVKEETRQRIIKLAQELGYRPNLVARSLRTDQTCTVAIIADNICSPFTPTPENTSCVKIPPLIGDRHCTSSDKYCCS
jgi:DNA-binding LacI/PurR family transcriptional regulator